MTTNFLHGIEVIQINDGIRAIQTVRSSVIGIIGIAPDANTTAFPVNTPVLVRGPNHAKQLDTTGNGLGTLTDALDDVWDQVGARVIVVRVDEAPEAATTISNVVGNATNGTGVHAFLTAESVTKLAPRILCAPGFTSLRPGNKANPVTAELVGIAERLRAVIIADGPGTTHAEAVTYAADFGSDRVYVIDPPVTVFTGGKTVVRPASARVAGLIAKTDNESGFWFSPSNRPLNGITGSARPISFGLSDSACDANHLNENKIATIVHRDGYRLWGNRTTASDPQWAFLSVRRTADMIYESIEQAMLWAADKPYSGQLLRDITGTVEAYLRTLKARGAILGGDAWLDEENNTETSLKAGQLYINFDIEPPAPMERITFKAHRNGTYYEEVLSDFGDFAGA